MDISKRRLMWIVFGSTVLGVAGLVVYQILRPKPKPDNETPRTIVVHQSEH